MLQHSPYFWNTIVVLLGTAAYSVMMGGMARTEAMRVFRYPLALIATGIWAYAIFCCINLIHAKYGFALAIPGMFWASVFFLGAMVVTVQEITAVNGKVHLRKGSVLYWILTKWGGAGPHQASYVM